MKSEAEELESLLSNLEGIEEIREIAGWESGFPSLSRVLNGILPGLYFLVGSSSSGKTAFAKQLCDQVVRNNSVPAIFITFSEKKNDLRIRTLARLSGLENREIRRGRSFILHWYGVPKPRSADPSQTPPSWEKLRGVAEEAKSWLGLLYLCEAGDKTDLKEIEEWISNVREIEKCQPLMVVIDDSQYLGALDSSLDTRLLRVSEQLQGLALREQIPVLATWPALSSGESHRAPQSAEWAARVPGADVVVVLEGDVERTKKLTEPNQAINLHIVKNRGGQKGTLCFDFFPSLSKFTEVALESPP